LSLPAYVKARPKEKSKECNHPLLHPLRKKLNAVIEDLKYYKKI